MADDGGAEFEARLAVLTEGGLRRLLRLTAEASHARAKELVLRELRRRGLAADQLPDEAGCTDYWHTVTSLRTPWCPSCRVSTTESLPITPATRTRKFRPRRQTKIEREEAAKGFWENFIDVIDD
jgi:hypothetical protein